MPISEIRELLVPRIQTIEDENFLNAIKVLTYSKMAVDQPYELDEIEKQKIDRARNQVKR